MPTLIAPKVLRTNSRNASVCRGGLGMVKRVLVCKSFISLFYTYMYI